MFIRLNYFVKSINKLNSKDISLTFDDGPDTIITPKILDILAQKNVKATFFVIGSKIAENKEIILRIQNEGHIIGNHSFSHNKKLTILSTSKLKKDIHQCSKAIEEITKIPPSYFRPPFGVTTPRYKRALHQLNMQSVGWSVRSLDTISKDKNKLFDKLTSKIVKGAIFLFHDTQTITLDVLPDFIDVCRKKGINIVSLPK